MLLIVFCSVLALMVIVYKMITLTKASVVPGRLAGDIELIETHYENDHLERLRAEFREGDSSLYWYPQSHTNHTRSFEMAMQRIDAIAHDEHVIQCQ